MRSMIITRRHYFLSRIIKSVIPINIIRGRNKCVVKNRDFPRCATARIPFSGRVFFFFSLALISLNAHLTRALEESVAF